MKIKTKAKKCVIKRKFEDYKNCLEVAQHENKIKHIRKKRIVKDTLKTRQQRFKSKSIMVLLKKKIALSSNDDK